MTEPPVRIEFFFDLGSPYSYLASTQLAALGERLSSEVRWRPFLVGAVFKATAAPQMSPTKGRYLMADLQRWAESYGVAFNMATRFPLNTLLAQRTLSALEVRAASGEAGEGVLHRAASALFEAYWVADRDISQAEVIAGALDQAQLPGAALVAAASESASKEALRQTTDEAIARGAFGAPTFFVGEAMFWGNDRLAFVERAFARALR